MLAFAAGALLLAACSDDDDDGSEATAEAESEDDDDSASSDDEATEDERDGDDEEVEGLPEDFNELLTDIESFRAEYEISGQDDEGNELSGNLTLLALDGNLRLDFEDVDFDGEAFSASIIATTDALYFCGEDLQEDEDGTCFEFAGADDLDETGIPFGDLLGDIIPLADEAGIEVTDADDQEVAGEDADCVTVTQEQVEDELGGESLVCLAESGLPLLVEGSAEGGEFRLEATDVSDDVSLDDFELPFPAEELDFGDLGDFDLDDFDTSDDDTN